MALITVLGTTAYVPNPIEGILAPVFNSNKLTASDIFPDFVNFQRIFEMMFNQV